METFQEKLGTLEFEFKVNTERLEPEFKRTRTVAIFIMILLAALFGLAALLWSEHRVVLSVLGIAFVMGIGGYLYFCQYQLGVMSQTSVRLHQNGLWYVAPKLERLVTYSDIMDVQLKGGPKFREVVLQEGIAIVSHLSLGPLGFLTPSFFDSKQAGCFLYTRTGPRLRVPSFIPRLDLLADMIRERQLTR